MEFTEFDETIVEVAEVVTETAEPATVIEEQTVPTDESAGTTPEVEPIAEIPNAGKTPAKQTRARPPYQANAVAKLGRIVDDGNDLLAVDVPGEAQRAEIADMKKAIRAGSICYGKVVGVEPHSESRTVNLVIKRETLRIIVPAEDFFAHSVMREMDIETADGKYRRYLRKASHTFGAIVSFVPKGMAEDEKGVPFVIASRKEAMDKLQEKHFFGPNADVELGSVAKASIVSVGPRYITVECLGLEVVIGSGGLSAFEYLEDVSKKFQTGRALMVAVEKLEVDVANRKVTASLSHSLVERLQTKVETVSERLIHGRYAATVVAVLPKYYVVILTGLKLRGLISTNGGCISGETLIVGDEVIMEVTGISEDRNLVYGRCMKPN